jgi:rod shape-determining protein MreD
MRWAAYFIFAYLALGLQLGLAPEIAYHGAAPNLVLLAAIFISLNAPRDAALLGCFAMGIMQDFLSSQPPGLFALSYGLVAMFVISTQHIVYRGHPLTHFSLALVGGLMTMTVLLLHGWIHPPGAAVGVAKAALPAVRISPATEFTRVLYTAALAPFVLWGLQRTRGMFGFQPSRRKTKSW